MVQGIFQLNLQIDIDEDVYTVLLLHIPCKSAKQYVAKIELFTSCMDHIYDPNLLVEITCKRLFMEFYSYILGFQISSKQL